MRRFAMVAPLLLLPLASLACDEPESVTTGPSVTAQNTAFTPAEVSVSQDDTLEFINEDPTTHNFTVQDLEIDEDAEESQLVPIEMADFEPGTYDFFCKFHQSSMTGTLEITE